MNFLRTQPNDLNTVRLRLTTFLTFLITVISFQGFAQKTYLKIHKGTDAKDVIMYPPGTIFELKNEHHYVVMRYSETPRTYLIDGKYKLVVHPTYKKQKDIYYLDSGKVELALTANFGKTNSIQDNYASNGITAEVDITDSNENKGYKNLVFKLSNGIVFNYSDGKYNASLNGMYLDIKHKYIIASELGELRLSFSPKNGEVWWVFKPKKL